LEHEELGQSPRDVHVGSGAFRVDRERALEKLVRFQMPDPDLFLLPWLRAAVASEAKGVWISHDAQGLEFSFDGLSWTAAELRDPYRCLFAEEDEAPGLVRNRELAVGILTALRLTPRLHAIALQFQDADAVRVLRIEGLHGETLSEIPPGAIPEDLADSRGIRMRIRLLRPGRCDAALGHLEKGSRWAPVRISADSRVWDKEEALAGKEFEASFSEPDFRGRCWLSPRSFSQSRVEWIVLGTTVAVEQLVLPGVQVSATLMHDGLAMTASQTGVAHDALYRRCLDALTRHATSLLARAQADLEFHGAALFRALRSAEYRREWMPWEEQTTGESVLSGLLEWKDLAGDILPGRSGESVSEDRRLRGLVRRFSLAIGAARAASLLHRAEMEGDAAPANQALWGAAVALDGQGRPLSLRTLDDQRRWLGCVPFMDATTPEAAEGFAAAWTPRETDRRYLEDYFSGNVRPAASVRAPELPSGPLRAQLTDSNLLIRIPFERGKVRGEFGLSLSPHPRYSRIRWMRSGHAFPAVPWPLGGLRLEAAIDDPGLAAAPNPQRLDGPVMRVLADLLESAGEAYRRLGEEYDPEDPGPRDAIIREHLLDLVCDAWDAQAERWKSRDWLDGVALFRERGGGMVSMRAVRAAAAKGAPLSIFVSSHPDGQLEMTQGYPRHVPKIFAGSTQIKELLPVRGFEAPVAPAPVVDIVPVRPVRVAAAPAKPVPEPAPAPRPEGIDSALRRGPPGLAEKQASPSPALALRSALMEWSRSPAGKPFSRMLLLAVRVLERRECADALEASRLLALLEGMRRPGELQGYLLATAFTAMRRRAGGQLTDSDEAAFLEVLLAAETGE